MWGEWMNDPVWEEQRKRYDEEIQRELELEEKIFRISHPILAKIGDARIWLGKKILGISEEK